MNYGYLGLFLFCLVIFYFWRRSGKVNEQAKASTTAASTPAQAKTPANTPSDKSKSVRRSSGTRTPVDVGDRALLDDEDYTPMDREARQALADLEEVERDYPQKMHTRSCSNEPDFAADKWASDNNTGGGSNDSTRDSSPSGGGDSGGSSGSSSSDSGGGSSD